MRKSSWRSTYLSTGSNLLLTYINVYTRSLFEKLNKFEYGLNIKEGLRITDTHQN